MMWLAEKFFGKSTTVLAVSMVVGLIVCYAFGTAWFMAVYTRSTGEIGLMAALGWCVFPYIIPDLIKIAVALLLCRRLRKAIPSL
jgi:biotin transport system substrate-specific component